MVLERPHKHIVTAVRLTACFEMWNGRREMAKRERYLFVCINRRAEGHPMGSCAEKGSEEIH